MDKSRYNWTAIIQAAAYLTDEPATNGLEGNGFSISRVDSNKLTIVVTEGQYDVAKGPEEASQIAAEAKPEAVSVTPEHPTPVGIVGTPEAPNEAPSAPVVASESAPTPAPTQDAPTPTVTGQGEVATGAVPTGQ